MTKVWLEELHSSSDELNLSEKTLSAFKVDDKKVQEVKEEYQKLAISALTICCTCD